MENNLSVNNEDDKEKFHALLEEVSKLFANDHKVVEAKEFYWTTYDLNDLK